MQPHSDSTYIFSNSSPDRSGSRSLKLCSSYFEIRLLCHC